MEKVCDMHMLCKTGSVCLRVVDPHLIFDRICVRTNETQTLSLLTEDLALALKKLLSLCPIPLLPTLLSGGHM